MSDWDFGGAYAGTAKTLQDTAQSAQALPIELQQMQAHTRASNAYADISEQEALSRKTVRTLMQGMTLDPRMSGSAQLLQMGGITAQAGDPVGARELFMRSAQARAQETREIAAAASYKRQEAELNIKKAERYGQLMDNVLAEPEERRPAAFALANQVFQQQMGEQAPMMEYHPDLVRAFAQGSRTVANQLRHEHNQAMEGLAGQRAEDTRTYRDDMMNFRREEEARRVGREARLAANSGTDVGAPTKEDLAGARTLLEQQKKLDGLDPESQKRAVLDLASRAKALRKQTRGGLDWSAALTRSLTEQIGEGYFAMEAIPQLGGLFHTEKPVYGKPGLTPDRVIPVPADAAQRKPNTFYKTPEGTFLYLGPNRWKPVKVPAGGGGGASNAEDDGAYGGR